MTRRYKQGFTLIELLVVTTIIILLSAIGMVSFTNASISARNAKRKADMETIRQALMLYKQQNGSYPASYQALAGTYLSEPIPMDPKTNAAYPYYTQGTGCICSDAEDTKGNSSNNSCSAWVSNSTGAYFCAKGL